MVCTGAGLPGVTSQSSRPGVPILGSLQMRWERATLLRSPWRIIVGMAHDLAAQQRVLVELRPLPTGADQEFPDGMPGHAVCVEAGRMMSRACGGS